MAMSAPSTESNAQPINQSINQSVDDIIKEIKSNAVHFDPSKPCVWSSAFAGKLLQGTAGWTDPSINQSVHKFYPNWVKNSVDRLKHYCQYFPMVEVDTSNYSIPSINQAINWSKAVHDGFLFHYKIFGLFTFGSCQFNAIPGVLREQCLTDLENNQSINQPISQSINQSINHSINQSINQSNPPDRVHLSSLSSSFKQLIWSHWNRVIEPVHRSNKLGLTIFQFPLGFVFSERNQQHLIDCRFGLDARYRMGVEFRDRSWVTEQNLEHTINMLKLLDVTLIAEDDLTEEVHNIRACIKSSNQSISQRLPIILKLTSTHSLYIRMHRRVGDQRGDRVLHPYEFVEWKNRLIDLYEQDDQSPKRVYFFSIGTDCMDDPLTNASKMDEILIHTTLSMKWREIAKALTDSKQSSIIAMFNQQEKTNKRARDQSIESDDELVIENDQSSPSNHATKTSKSSSLLSSINQSTNQSTSSISQSSSSINQSISSPRRAKTAQAKKPKIANSKISAGTPSITSFFQPKQPKKS